MVCWTWGINNQGGQLVIPLPVILTTINQLVMRLLINIENDSIVINNNLHQSFIKI